MDEKIKQDVVKRLDLLSDDAGRQLLDYMDFLESRYNRSRRPQSTVERIAKGIDDTFGTGEIASSAAKGAAGLVDAAGKVMSNLASASRSVADELANAASDATKRPEPSGEAKQPEASPAEQASPVNAAPVDERSDTAAPASSAQPSGEGDSELDRM